MEKQYQLPREFGEKWVSELRSGKWKQITSTLCKDGGYCCLGVSGAITGLNDNDMAELSDLSDFYYLYKGSYTFDKGIKELANDQKLQNDLMNLNDKDGKSFTEIADWIESNVEFI